MHDYFDAERKRAGNVARVARIDAMYAREALSLKHPEPIGTEMYTPQSMTPNTDSATGGISQAVEKPMSPAELQKLDQPPTPAGVKRDQFGYIYPPAGFEVL